HPMEYFLKLERLLDVEAFCRRKLPLNRRQSCGERVQETTLALRQRAGRRRHMIFCDLKEPVAFILAHSEVGFESLAILEREARDDLLLGLAHLCIAIGDFEHASIDTKHGNVCRETGLEASCAVR